MHPLQETRRPNRLRYKYVQSFLVWGCWEKACLSDASLFPRHSCRCCGCISQFRYLPVMPSQPHCPQHLTPKTCTSFNTSSFRIPPGTVLVARDLLALRKPGTYAPCPSFWLCFGTQLYFFRHSSLQYPLFKPRRLNRSMGVKKRESGACCPKS